MHYGMCKLQCLLLGVYNIISTGVTAGGILDVDITTVAIDNLLVS